MDTKNYSSSFRKTLSSGISALIKSKQPYYILVHMVGSHYHQAGEQQGIMLDEIILGRDTDCHVRFDENFSTVSRHHASIKRDGDNWCLVQMSKKNTTFLNGKAVQESWYLQHGDEIQLAVNGPKLIFKIPEEETEFNVTQRLNSFKEQVIRPYKTAFIVVCSVVALIIAGSILAGIVIMEQNETLGQQYEIIQKQKKQIDDLYNQLLQTNEQLERNALKADFAQKEAIRAKSIAFKERAERIKSQENIEEMQSQMQQLRGEMNSYYDGIINGENQQ